jgi:hypothetical protein
MAVAQADLTDVQLTVSSSSGSMRFHLGELIRLQTRYTATTPGKYFLAGEGLKVERWVRPGLACAPMDHVIERDLHDGRVTAWPFLHQACDGGMGASFGQGLCSDCDSLTPLGPKPVFGEIVVNQLMQFTRPGTYSCFVADRSIVAAADAPHYRAFNVSSKHFNLDITDDSAWSASALKDVLDRLAAEKCKPVQDDSYHCMELAQELAFLETPDSLAAMAQMLTGGDKLPPWQQQLWLGLFQSRHQDDVIRLLEMRFTDPDFAVTTDNMEELTGIRLRKAFPQAFAKDAKPEDHRTAAVFLLQETLRNLGDSLPNKSPQAKTMSLKTYQELAENSFCQPEPVIPDAERTRVLRQAVVAARPTPK